MEMAKEPLHFLSILLLLLLSPSLYVLFYILLSVIQVLNIFKSFPLPFSTMSKSYEE